MEPLRFSKQAVDDYCYDSQDDENELGSSFRDHDPKRLVEGISLKDLREGNDVTFELVTGYNDDVFSEEFIEEIDTPLCNNSKNMRENRGAPPLGCSFKTLASKMFDLGDDGFVKKQIITKGVGKQVPDFAYVTVHYNMYKENCEVPFDSTYLRGCPEKFKLDQGEALEGLERAVKSMKKKENSRFFIKWEVAFGEMGCPDRIEEKCDIVADVTLVNFAEIGNDIDLNGLTDAEIYKVDFNKSINRAKREHRDGNDEYEKQNFKGAVKCYRSVVRMLNDLKLANEEQEAEMLKLKLKALVNLAVSYNKIGKNEQACLACQDALAIDHNNIKANFHYGKATLALSNFTASRKYLMKANALKPCDKDIIKELAKLDEKIGIYKMNDKIFCKKAFNEIPPVPAKVDVDSIPEGYEEHAKDLTETLTECFKVNSKPFALGGRFEKEELKVCEMVAKSLNLDFTVKDDHVCFEKKNKKN